MLVILSLWAGAATAVAALLVRARVRELCGCRRYRLATLESVAVETLPRCEVWHAAYGCEAVETDFDE